MFYMRFKCIMLGLTKVSLYTQKVVCESDLYHYSSKENYKNFLGGDSIVETPVPIPNTEVKRYTPKILVWRRTGKIGTAKD